MQVSVIIVTFNDLRNTANCIRSVIENTKDVVYEIILVDNNSTSVSPHFFAEDFPKIKIIRSRFNGGFAHANNLGIREASGDIVLLLNNDTILHEDSISKCYHEMIKDWNIGVMGCRMVYPDGSIQFTARKFKSIAWELYDTFRFVLKFMPYMKRSRTMLAKYFNHDETVECDWVTGAFFMFRRSILKYLPGEQLDNRFYMSAEDQLWCYQIKQRLSYKVVFNAGTTITHICGASRNDKSKEISFRWKMLNNEFGFIGVRYGYGFKFQVYYVLYGVKESCRTIIKWLFYKTTKRLIK